MARIWELHQKKDLNVLGLMSGTSLDGLDICLARIEYSDNELNVHLMSFSEESYSDEFRQELQALADGHTRDVCRMNFKITEIYSQLIRRFLEKHRISTGDIDLIGSHGQTIWHEHRRSTLQIGEAAVLREQLGIPVISDFRVADVAAGGSGAPLVPFLDYVLFRKMKKNLLVLNIGGIANFTFIPKDAKSLNDIYALDTGPGNSLIDICAQLVSKGRQSFDNNGRIAASGTVCPEILDVLMAHPYIRAEMPKSTGREIFGKAMVDELIETFKLDHKDYPDLLATVTRFTAAAIYSNYRQFFGNMGPIDEIIISGGGADNPMIMHHLRELFADTEIKRSDSYGIPGAAKEALAFAVLAAAAVWNIPANVPNVTGARRPVVMGKMTI